MPVKVKRKIINIDEELCNGCGDCIPGCPEQALQLVDTPDGKKARMVREIYCDGLGACLGHCPTGALTVVEREADEYDDEATVDRIKKIAPGMLEEHNKHLAEHAHELKQQTETEPSPTAECGGGCPSARAMQWDDEGNEVVVEEQAQDKAPRLDSKLRQWPVQLHLLAPQAPYLKNADLAFVADCVPFAYSNFHADFVKNKVIAVGCPKLDDARAYVDKIAQIFTYSRPRRVSVIKMEVPCCSGLVQIVKLAMQQAGLDMPLEVTTISIKGEILDN